MRFLISEVFQPIAAKLCRMLNFAIHVQQFLGLSQIKSGAKKEQNVGDFGQLEDFDREYPWNA